MAVAPLKSDAPPTPSPAGAAVRQLTADEINQVRQLELRDGDNVRVRIDPDLRRRFAEYINMSVADFNKLPPMQQAFMIIDKGKPDMARNVKILSDPPAIASFRKDVERTLVAGCATSKCHGGPAPGAFRLFPRENESAAFTNFVIVQQYSAHTGPPGISHRPGKSGTVAAAGLSAAPRDHGLPAP